MISVDVFKKTKKVGKGKKDEDVLKIGVSG
jgi:hypothetical protein